MSFILDALRKSENERQKKDTPDVTAARYKAGPARSRIWLPILGAVLVINALLLLVLLFRADGNTPSPETSAAVTLPASPVSPARMAPSARPAPTVRPLAREVMPATPAQSPGPASPAASFAKPAPVIAATSPPSAMVDSTAASGGLPSMRQLVLDGALEMNSLRLDMHVYSPVPAERFVFINMQKYREGEQLKEGPQIESIDAGGVILTHQGQRFTLERE